MANAGADYVNAAIQLSRTSSLANGNGL